MVKGQGQCFELHILMKTKIILGLSGGQVHSIYNMQSIMNSEVQKYISKVVVGVEVTVGHIRPIVKGQDQCFECRILTGKFAIQVRSAGQETFLS